MRTWLSLLFLVLTAGVFYVIWDSSRLLYATPETQSAFLKTYNPQQVIERFRCDAESSYRTGGAGSGAGEEFVTHKADFDWFFAMQPDRMPSLMTTLDDDLAAQLKLSGARILSRIGDVHTGFQYHYRIGKTVGRITIAPVALNSRMHRPFPLPKSLVDVETKIELAENWYPKEQTAVQASFDSLH